MTTSLIRRVIGLGWMGCAMITSAQISKQSADPRAELLLWQEHFRNFRQPMQTDATDSARDTEVILGVTVWDSSGPVPKRASVYETYSEGRRLRLSIESSRAGYLYVLHSKDGSLRQPNMIFPAKPANDADYRVLPGRLIMLPSGDNRVPPLTMSRTSQTGQPGYKDELFIVIVSPKPLKEFGVGARSLSAAQLSKWLNDWPKPVVVEDSALLDTPMTSAESEASRTSQLLTRNEPLPQTLYGFRTQPTTPFALRISLKIAPPKPSLPVISAAPGHDVTGHPQDKPPSPAMEVQIPREASSRVTASSFLTHFANESAGYGLYSYFLFGSRPESPATERWRRYYETTVEFLGMPTALEISGHVSDEKVNISFLPVTIYEHELPSPATPMFFAFDRERKVIHEIEHKATGKRLPPSHKWPPHEAACILVGNYDYARAQVLLSLWPDAHFAGPYIISTRQPLSTLKMLPEEYLYQDLSSVPPDLISLWVREFMAQSQEKEFWKTRTKEQFVLRLRTAVGVLSGELPDFSGNIKWTFATIVPR